MDTQERNIEAGNENMVWAWDQKLDKQMSDEAERLKSMYEEKKISAYLVLRLAFQSLGVVYGDLGTSPLYVYYNTFPEGIKHKEDVIGALSLIIYSLTLLPLLKYVFIVCRANDNGQGGTFALYSLLCRHANLGSIPNQDKDDKKLTTYSCYKADENSFAAKTIKWLEHYPCRKDALLVLVLIGSCMVIGDGILTPAISVLSAVGGIQLHIPKMTDDLVVVLAVVVLVTLFSIQHYGVDKVGLLFAPVLLAWFLLIGGIGIFNLWKYDASVLKAFSPVYIYRYFRRGGLESFTSLGGIMLSITGTEALFADLSNFSVSSVQIAFTTVVFPSLLLAYSGQAAYLMENSEHVFEVFYRSIPDIIYWPTLVIATGAAIVASQATITATFSLVKQALALGCFPRVKVVYTSRNYLSQIYIPEINWILMVLCIAVTAGFKHQNQIGNATGVAVVIVMLVTTVLMVLIMVLVWHLHWSIVLIFALLSVIVEGTYFCAVLFKVNQGGWVPLVIGAAFFIIMWIWHYGTRKHYEFEMHSKISTAYILGLGPSLGLTRVPGVGLVYTEIATGVPHIFSHFITNIPAIHSVLIFVCIKSVPVYSVPEGERFLIRRIGPSNFGIFRCIARYGYKDSHSKDDGFESKVLDNLYRFVHIESLMDGGSDSDDETEYSGDENMSYNESTTDVEMVTVGTTNELEYLKRCVEAGVVHILGNTVVVARGDSNMFKKIAIDYIYAFLKKICRDNGALFYVPHESSLNVGQIISV